MKKDIFSASELAKAVANQNLKAKSTKKSRQKSKEAKIPWDETRYYTIQGQNVTHCINRGSTAFYNDINEAKKHKAKFGGYYYKVYRKGKGNNFKHIGYGCPR